MDLIEFTWGALVGGIYYDTAKIILGASYSKLHSFVKENKKDEFKSHLETIFDANENIKHQLEELQNNGEVNINSKNKINLNGNNNTISIG